LRFLIGVLALGAIVFGWLAPTFPWGISLGLQSAVIMGAGFLALAVAVFMPAVREVELGISPTVKLGPALSNRQAELRSVFEQQKGDLEYCAHLLCDDPGEARRLLEAAWSQVAGTWVGPVTPQLRVYTLCVFVEKLRKYEQYVLGRPLDVPPADSRNLLGRLPYHQRVAIVLHEFANLTVAEIAGITGRTAAQEAKSLALADKQTSKLAIEGGKP
jgi:hypothetical protein